MGGQQACREPLGLTAENDHVTVAERGIPVGPLHLAAEEPETGEIVGGKKLVEFPPLTWVHFEIRSEVGKESSGSWNLRVTPAGGPVQVFDGLAPKQRGGVDLRWLGFISSGTAASKAWLDNLEIHNH
jgi:hypothetical protein